MKCFPTGVAVLAIACTVSSLPAAAGSSAAVTTRYSGLADSGPTSASVNGPSNAGREQATAAASGAVGALKISGTALATADPTVWIERLAASSTASASWSDTQVFRVATVPLGVPLEVNARILFSGALSTLVSGNGLNASLTARSDWAFTATYNGTNTMTGSGFDQWFSDSGRSQGQNINGVSVSALGSFPMKFMVVNGATLTASFQATAHALANAYAPNGPVLTASSSYGFGNSIYWDGIDSVTYNGVVVPYVVIAGSGVDYTQSFAPVPEPASAALMLAGLVGIGRALRRPPAFTA